MSEVQFKKQPKGFATKAIHVGQDPDQWSGNPVIPPLIMSTTFKQHDLDNHEVKIDSLALFVTYSIQIIFSGNKENVYMHDGNDSFLAFF